MGLTIFVANNRLKATERMMVSLGVIMLVIGLPMLIALNTFTNRDIKVVAVISGLKILLNGLAILLTVVGSILIISRITFGVIMKKRISYFKK